MANWSRWPNQPWMGVRSSFWSARADVEERGRAGAGVEVLVGAPDGEVDAVLLEADLDRSRRVAQVPAHERACRVSGLRDRRQVGQRAGAVRDVREDDQPHVACGARGLHVGDGRALDRVGLDEAEVVGDAFEHVAVGGEVVDVGHDRPPVRARGKNGRGQLEEVDGHGVGDDDLIGPRAEDVLRELVAGRRRELDPVVPPADEVASPALNGRRERCLRPLRQAAERVAVDVQRPALLVNELVAEAGERVVAVERRRRRSPVGVGSPSGAKSSGQ